MMKCEILFDRDKITREGEYTPEAIETATDEVFSELDLVKGENGFYYGKGSEKDFVNFMSSLISLSRQEWFFKYVKKYLWYNPSDTDTPEDALKTFHNMGVMI